MLPNFGIPGTSINVAEAMRAYLPDLFAQAVQSNFGEILAICVFEYRDPGGPETLGADLLGYEIYVLGHGSPVLAGLPLVIIGLLGLIAIFTIIDQITGGKLHQSFLSSYERVVKGGADIVGAPFKGQTEVLILSIAFAVGMALLVGKLPISSTNVKVTRDILSSGAAVTGATGGLGRETGAIARAAGRAAGRGL
jgi:hypothetical protein